MRIQIPWPVTVVTAVIAIAIGYAAFVLQMNRGIWDHALYGAQEFSWSRALATIGPQWLLLSLCAVTVAFMVERNLRRSRRAAEKWGGLKQAD